MPKVIALTGGIGSGKTFVSSIFNKLNKVPCFYSDFEAKKIMNENQLIKKQIISILGPESYIGDKLNNEYLRKKIFYSQNKLNMMNKLVHNQVKINFRKWLSNQNSKYVLKETAILFEHNLQIEVDLTLLVTAPLKVRIERIIKRDNISKKTIEKIIENQWSDKEKTHLSDFFIENLNKSNTIKKVKNLVEIFSSL